MMNANQNNAQNAAQNTALMEKHAFLLPTMVESDFSQEELSVDMDGVQMSFQRVKIPGGGALQFEIPSDDPENPDYTKTLEGVILFHHLNNAYWPEGSEFDDSTTPLCASNDGKLGTGEPGGLCATCALNQYGTASGSAGKACKNMRTLYLLRSGDMMPLQVTLPPTSLRPFNEFSNRSFLMRRRASFGSVVQIGLKKMNNGSNDYSVATFRRLYDFEGEQLAQIRAYAGSFKAQIQEMLGQRAALQQGRSQDICDYGAGEVLSADGAEAFQFGQTIDGDRQALPA